MNNTKDTDCSCCSGTGLIGGFVNTDSGYQVDPCPVCNEQEEPVELDPYHLSNLTKSELRAEIELLRIISDQNVMAGIIITIYQNELARREDEGTKKESKD